MPDSLRALLTREAEARLAGTAIPPVGELHRRATAPVEAERRRRAWLTPFLAAAAVIVVVAAAAQVPALRHRAAETAVIPPAPTLGPVVPPLVVRQRLGAPFGHLNGPPVASAQTLAISPANQDGLRLRTVAVVTPHTPDREGRPRVNRCVYTYSTPGAAAMHGRCDWALSATLWPVEQPLTLEVHGAPGRTWLSGTAPATTAAVLLRSPGRKQVAVAVADPGAAWNHRPVYVAWHSRTATDLVAVDLHGQVLARTRLPSDRATHNPGDPELGSIETPLGLWEQYAGSHRPTPRPARVDLLATYRISDTVTLLRYGFGPADSRCTVNVIRDYGPDAQPGGGSGGCGSSLADPPEPIQTGRSFSAGTGQPQEQLLSGSAEAGTVRVRLSAPGRTTVEVRAYDGGDRWKHRAFFIAPWPSAPATRIQALGREGQLLASVVSRGLNLRAFDADFLEAEATCMERRGIQVIRMPQGHGVPPAYGFRPGTLTTAQMRTAQESCEDEASRLTS
jgi:hypothetical protein